MKDRWKIFWISVFICLILAALFLFMGFSLRKVDLGNYGILRYDYYDTVDASQSPRTNGNYLVGLDHSFIQYPRSLIVHEFSIKTLTKDKSMIQIQGIYAEYKKIGNLVYSELVNLYFQYGKQYQKYLFASVQQLFHQGKFDKIQVTNKIKKGIQQFSLNEIISNRREIDLYIKNYVKTNIQTQYQWIQTKFINLGNNNYDLFRQINIYQGGIKTQLLTKSIQTDISIQQNYLNKINNAIFNQKKLNIYQSGGFQLLDSLQKMNEQLLYNISKQLRTVTEKLMAVTPTKDTNNIIPAMQYVINGDNLPLIDNQVEMLISK